jgi:hypothetical protein
MPITASELRANVYKLLDEVIETGVPLVIERNGHRLRIEPEVPVSKLDQLPDRPDAIVGDPEDFVHIDWSDYWKPYLP